MRTAKCGFVTLSQQHGLAALAHCFFFFFSSPFPHLFGLTTNLVPPVYFSSSVGRVDSASASGAVDSGLIPSLVKPINFSIHSFPA